MIEREYRDGEAAELVALWSRAYGHLGGYVTRTPEHWHWAVLERPGVETADVRVVESQGTVIAYGALGPAGAILEFAVEPLRAPATRAAALTELLQALERQARRRDYDFVTCAAPASDAFIARQLQRAGYHSDEGVFVTLGIVDPLQLIRHLLRHRRPQLHGWPKRFLLDLTPGLYRELPQTRLAIDLGADPVVTDCSHRDWDVRPCQIATDLTVLTDVLFGSVSAAACLAGGQIRVSPPESAGDALRLLDTLSLRTPWQVPTSDVF